MPSLLERPKMTRAMYEALKRHIMREREKKKQVKQEQDAMMERLRKERELKKKKEEEDNLTLEQTNEQIITLEKRLEELKQQKKDIYSQLKKASHQEDETLKRAQQKEQSELTMSQPSYPHPALTAPQPMLIHGRPALYKPTVPPPMLTGMKRQRSPTPPPSSSSSSAYSNYGHSEPKYLHTSENKYVPHARGGAGGAADVGKYPSHAEAAAKFSSHQDPKYLGSPYQPGGKVGGGGSGGHLYAAQHPPQPGDFKSSVFQPGSSSHLYAPTQAAALQQQVAAAAAAAGNYPASQSGAGKYPGSGQSAFTSYQSQFAQSHPQKALAEQFSAAYPIQRMQQPGYHPSLQLQQSLDHAGQKQAGFEDKYKHSQGQLRGLVPPPQQPTMMSQSQALQLQQQQAKNSGAFVPGYPARSQPGGPPTSYPSATSSSTYSNPNSVQQGRPDFSGQSHGRYY